MFRSAFANAKRYRQPLSLLLLDFDDFKKLNDAHGHLTGDAVLKHAARMLTARTRESDVVARYGGEEFAIVLPNTDLNGAMALAESIRVDIAKRAVVPFTVSIGCACYAEGVKTPDRLIALADESLYQAKRTGRNRIASVQAEPEKFRGSA
jgi:diguanylate cyclase (GGDEF)-like protein